MEQKHIDIIKICLQIQKAFGNDKSKSDIEETIMAIDEAMFKGDITLSDPCESCFNYNIGDGIEDIEKCKECKTYSQRA